MKQSNKVVANSEGRRFHYRPLNRQAGEIRLLHILPDERLHAPIECTLEYYPLEGPDTGYEALSYTWGGSERTESIFIDGESFAVTMNLHEALVRLRDTCGYRVLWIDAICINQDDLQERSVEVLRMLRIYQRSERVVVWLGSESENSGLAMQHFRELDIHWKFRCNPALRTRFMRLTLDLFIRSLGIGFGALSSIRSQPFSTGWLVLSIGGWLPPSKNVVLRLLSRLFTTIAGLQIANHVFQTQYRVASAPYNKIAQQSPETTSALKEFFERSWFRRAWIVQEIAAAEDVLVICGSEEIPWWLLDNALEEIQHRIANASVRSTYLDTNYLQGPLLRIASTAALSSIEPAMNVCGGGDSSAFNRLSDLLSIFRYTEATDMRDKIYALLGLCHGPVCVEQHYETRPCPGTPKDSVIVKPSYETPVWRVYAELVRSLTTSGPAPSLEILNQCQGYNKLANLPTWAPDWTIRYMDPSPPSLMVMKDLSFGTLPFPDLPLAHFSQDMRRMTVRGFTVGVIIGKGPLFALDPSSGLQPSADVTSDTRIARQSTAPLLWQIDREDVPSVYIVATRYLVTACTWVGQVGLVHLGLKIALAGAKLSQRLFPSSCGPKFTFAMDLVKDLTQILATMVADAKRKDQRARALQEQRKQSAFYNHLHEARYGFGVRDVIPLNKDNFFDSAVQSLRFYGAGENEEPQTQPRCKLEWATNLYDSVLGDVDIDATCRDPREGDVVVFLVGSHDAHLLRFDEEDGYWSLVGVADLGMRIRWMWRDAVREFDEGRRGLHTFTLK